MVSMNGNQHTISQPLVSCVIPAYNVVKSLEFSLSTFLQQTYHNFEIIIVDDGSDDGTRELSDSWSSKDARIKVIHTENHGVSYARNVGIKNASGEYLLFLDADDDLDTHTIEKCIQIMSQDLSDAVFFNYAEIDSATGLELGLDYPDFPSANHATPTTVMTSMLAWRIPWSAWMMFVRTSFLRQADILFPVGIAVGEDLAFTTQVIASASKISLLADPLYHYHRHPNSAMGQRYSTETKVRKSVSDLINVEQGVYQVVQGMQLQSSRTYYEHLIHFTYSHIMVPLWHSACSRTVKRHLSIKINNALLREVPLNVLKWKDRVKLAVMKYRSLALFNHSKRVNTFTLQNNEDTDTGDNLLNMQFHR